MRFPNPRTKSGDSTDFNSGGSPTHPNRHRSLWDLLCPPRGMKRYGLISDPTFYNSIEISSFHGRIYLGDVESQKMGDSDSDLHSHNFDFIIETKDD